MAKYRTLQELPDIQGKRVLVRSELNVPITDGVATDKFRVEMALPTIQELSSRGAKVLVIAHIGRDPAATLRPAYDALHELLPNCQFVDDLTGEKAIQAIETLPEGGVLVLENLRQHEGEKKNDAAFAQTLANLADYYVNDAFGATHRAHASITGVPALIPGFAGLLLDRELTELSKGLTPQSPSLFILGGAKFATKEPLLEAALDRFERIFIGGALANDFLKAEGFAVGTSLVSENSVEKAQQLIASGKLILPVDVTVESPRGVQVKAASEVQTDEKIVDVGPETVTELGTYITHAHTVLWNGPLGLFEGGYMDSTRDVAQLVASADVHSIVGGGDTVAAIRDLGLSDRYTFLSTGGGAMLDFLVDGQLPGVDALITSPQP